MLSSGQDAILHTQTEQQAALRYAGLSVCLSVGHKALTLSVLLIVPQ